MQNTSKQHTLWLLAAIAAPAAHFSGSGWLVTALIVIAILPLTALPKSWNASSKPVAVLQILWLGVVAGSLLPYGAVYWPSGNDLVVPLTIQTLAAFTKREAAPRVGAVLALCMAILGIPAVLSGAAHVQASWLKPTGAAIPYGLAVTLLLPSLPAAGEGEKPRRLAACGVMAVAFALLVQGVLGANVAQRVPDPFYQTARTLGDMEPVVAAGVTLGWYAMAAWMYHSAAVIAQAAGIGERITNVLVWWTSVGFVLLRLKPEDQHLAVMCLLMWVIVPLFRKNKKDQNSA